MLPPLRAHVALRWPGVNAISQANDLGRQRPTINGAAITHVPEWLERLAMQILPSALLCPLTVVVVLALVENGYLPG